MWGNVSAYIFRIRNLFLIVIQFTINPESACLTRRRIYDDRWGQGNSWGEICICICVCVCICFWNTIIGRGKGMVGLSKHLVQVISWNSYPCFHVHPTFNFSLPGMADFQPSPALRFPSLWLEHQKSGSLSRSKVRKYFVLILEKSRKINFFPLDSWWLAWPPAQSLFSTSTSTSGITSSNRDTETQTHRHIKEIRRHTQTQQDVSAELLNSTRCAISSKAFAAITLCGTTYHLLLTIERLWRKKWSGFCLHLTGIIVLAFEAISI